MIFHTTSVACNDTFCSLHSTNKTRAYICNRMSWPIDLLFQKKSQLSNSCAYWKNVNSEKNTLCLLCNLYFIACKPTVYRLLTSTILFLSLLFPRDIKGYLRTASCLHWNVVRCMLSRSFEDCSVLKRSCCATVRTRIQIYTPTIQGVGR